jgi:two-component system cell cycle sensor histidine kinase/response regulator CckA
MNAVSLFKPLVAETVRPLRILLVGQSPQDTQDILQELRTAGIFTEPTVVKDRQEFLQAIAFQEFSAILAADQFPNWSGIEALRGLHNSGKHVPFILIADELREDAAVECVKQGACDYVLRGHLDRLPMALTRALEEKLLRDANSEMRHALQESETRNRELIENSVYGVFRVSLDGGFLCANPALLRIMACTSLQVLQSLNLSSDVFRYPEHYVRLFTSCRENGLVHFAETEWRRKDGGLVTIKLYLRYLPVPGAPDQVEGIVEDITELRALERQLLQTQKFETIGQLAGGIAHDFNNVVGAILGWAELGYEESQTTPRVAERFARIREQADRAAALTRELLAFARRQALQPRPTDLNAVISNLAIFLDKVIGRDIEMKVVTGNIPAVQADPTQIEQVVMNLCLNARDAMPHGGRLLIETEMVELDDSYRRFYPYVNPGSYVVLSVSDTGVGMTPEIRDRIFEPFFTTKENGRGTGMGLATAYGIVKQHGGFIHVYSELGQGSLFRVYLPAMHAASPFCATHDGESPCALNLEGTETILIAEDHDSIREMVRQSLVNLGYRVLSAGDGEEALQLCDQETPALAVLDVVMPRMGGIAAAAHLRARFPGVAILFTSGYSESTDAGISQLPGSSFLQKPYSPTALGRPIRKILDPALSPEL